MGMREKLWDEGEAVGMREKLSGWMREEWG